MVNNQKLVMEPGRMLVLTRQNGKDFEKLDVNCHAIDYHSPEEMNLHDTTVKAFMANFSIPSALAILKPVHGLINSNDKLDRMTIDRLIKAAVVLGQFVDTPNPLESADMGR